MTELTNFIRFNEDGTLSGNIAALDFDFNVIGETLNSDKEDAPVYRLFGYSPRGRKVEIGGIWKQRSKQGNEYFQLTAYTPNRVFRANLGRYPGQDDESLMAVIPWS
ncbi:DUF736 family protein [Chelativorans sp. AA-79]|uniref:DUF736 domain-containing protein n=1 Tax=Chelativorans sp. AA-79 TaxID=3028735 RepID=UPI0023F91333|nr:DUF736 family protein [Chelativorans sp. AA-79]WEX12279.1 DUF736 family protein [Chelativorans sp. AA-79]